jgi:hypothetical protein
MARVLLDGEAIEPIVQCHGIPKDSGQFHWAALDTVHIGKHRPPSRTRWRTTIAPPGPPQPPVIRYSPVLIANGTGSVQDRVVGLTR